HTGLITYSPHPEIEEVFGSVRDYYMNQSLRQEQLLGKNNKREIINQPDSSNTLLPQWVVLPESIQYYNDNFSAAQIDQIVYDQATVMFGDISGYDGYAYIYAGDVVTSISSPFSPQANGNGYHTGESEFGAFAHIGTHVHELGHALFGAADEYKGANDEPGLNPMAWSLMATGAQNGPLGYNGHYQCPAPFAPPYRIELGWTNSIDISSDVINQNIIYNKTNPNFYKVDIPNSDEYFILEERKKDDFDLYTPTYSTTIGIIIWHAAPSESPLDFIQIETADNILNATTYDDDRFGNSVSSLTDYTSPSSNLRNDNYSFITFENIEKPQNIWETDILFYNNAIIIDQNTTWATNRTLDKSIFIKSGASLEIKNDITFSSAENEEIKFIVEDNASLKFNGWKL
ncbi:MAG: hypothetical protein KKG93_02710, partial [Bacteroidetes bacterium]|nr:hypothetical protein [Bacteroidota bacterium]